MKPRKTHKKNNESLSLANDLVFAEFLQDIVARFDPQFRHTYVNSAVEHFTGRPAQEFLGKTNRELGMPIELVEQWDQTIGDVFKTGLPGEVRFSFSGPERIHQFHSRLLPERDINGQVTSVVSIARELNVNASVVTAPAMQRRFVIDEERTKHRFVDVPPREFALSAIDIEHFRAIVESSDDAIIGKTLVGIVTSWNRGAENIFGYTASEMLGKSLMILFPKDKSHEEEFFVERLVLGEKIDHFETIRLHKDGRRIHVSVSISPIRNQYGEVVGAAKVARDVTPIKIEQERLQMALDATSNGLWDWNLLTGVVFRSDNFYRITGYQPEEDTHDFYFFQKTVHPEDMPRALELIEAHIKGKASHIEFEYRLISKQGFTGTWMMARGRAVEWDSAGLPLRIVGTLSDITNRKLIDASLRDREKRLSRVIDGSNQGYWDWNVQTNSLNVSARWETMLGYQPGEMDVSEGRFEQYVHPDDFADVMHQAEQHLIGASPQLDAEIRCLKKSGVWCWIQTRGRVVERDADGKALMMSGTHTDITERKNHQLSEREAATVFDNSYEGIMVVSPKGVITRVNQAFTRITGYAADEVIGNSPKLLSSGRQNTRFYRQLKASLLSKGFWRGEIWNRRKNGEIFAQLLSISTVYDDAGCALHHVGIFSDITQLKAHEAELDKVAHYDPLTGVPNRRLLSDRLEQSIARTNRSTKSLAVCYLDLDGFKLINDRYGHAAGDQLLIGVVENLKLVLRAEDTLARLGGDEFVLLFSDIDSPEECSLILERVLSSIKIPIEIDGEMVFASASIGVSLYPLDHVDADTLLRHADQAMYRAKETGKNRFHLFDSESDRKAQYHRQFVDRMYLALQTEEFRLYYQPKVNLLTGEIVGLEALLRWQHKEEGLLSPAQFLPHVEGSSVDHPLGIWVINTALKQVASWQAKGKTIKVSVNVSANHLLHPDFLSDLQEALAQHAMVQPACLELEVLESAAIGDITQAVEILDQCHGIGVRLALDDFGTGYSSLTYLRKLPVDILKIDQSFVRDMLKDPEDNDIVEGVIRLASAFKREVIAEGVETLEHGAALLQLGCYLAQGYGIARPMPADAVLAWAEDWTTKQAWKSLKK